MLVLPMPTRPAPPTPFHLKMRPIIGAIAAFQAVVAICRLISGDIWGGVSDLLVAILGFLASNAHVAMYVAYYGLMCFVNSIFDTVIFVSRLAALKYGYFDLEQHFTFNLESFSLLAATVLSYLGAAVCFAVFRDDCRERDSSTYLWQPTHNNYASAGFDGPIGPVGGCGNHQRPGASPPPSFSAFQGSGRRLGTGDGED
eukprot:TRINITY_DN69254_c0_g1_i1.p1 TRINITY_DN69254_c0_g1~~TRINITY_DN69254_c0_g1_i1.p1  ORF type:complete len:200 (+),score=28.19 TRINITY_DN69254_c0_g1_i1:165-764(+)